MNVSTREDWIKLLEIERREKDYFFREHDSSPLPWSLRPSFKGLSYFPIDPSYRFVVRLHKYERPERVTMATSKGAQKEYLRYGYIEFDIEGKAQKLQVYKSTPSRGDEHHYGDEPLFIPFRDATSGKESYGAARYLDADEDPSGEIVLDFNRAYNPYCAYSENYVCPFPPRENWLEVPIRAGEKKFEKGG